MKIRKRKKQLKQWMRVLSDASHIFNKWDCEKQGHVYGPGHIVCMKCGEPKKEIIEAFAAMSQRLRDAGMSFVEYAHYLSRRGRAGIYLDFPTKPGNDGGGLGNDG